MKVTDTPSAWSMPPATRTQATASPEPLEDARRGWNAGRLAAVLNMAAPKSHKPGMTLASPMLALAQRSPGLPHGSGDTFTDVTGKTGAPVSMARTPDEMAWEMIQALGDGAVISLEDARRALAVSDPGKISNQEQRIADYFRRVDSDHSGGLSQDELTRLLTYRHEHQDDDPEFGPRLPPTWV